MCREAFGRVILADQFVIVERNSKLVDVARWVGCVNRHIFVHPSIMSGLASDTTEESGTDQSVSDTPTLSVPPPIMSFGMLPQGAGAGYIPVGGSVAHPGVATGPPTYGEAAPPPFGCPPHYPYYGYYGIPTTTGQGYSMLPRFPQAAALGQPLDPQGTGAPLNTMPTGTAAPPGIPQYLPYPFMYPQMFPQAPVTDTAVPPHSPPVIIPAITRTPETSGAVRGSAGASPKIDTGRKSPVPVSSGDSPGRNSAASVTFSAPVTLAAEAGRISTASVAFVAPVGLVAEAGRKPAPVESEAVAGRKSNLPVTSGQTMGGKREKVKPAASASPVESPASALVCQAVGGVDSMGRADANIPPLVPGHAGSGPGESSQGSATERAEISSILPEKFPDEGEGFPIVFGFEGPPVDSSSPTHFRMVPAGAEREGEAELVLMDTSTLSPARASPLQASIDTPEGQSKSAKKRKRKGKKADKEPEVHHPCPVCPPLENFPGYVEHGLARHLASCQMHQHYLCPMEGCRVHKRRSSCLRDHICSGAHGEPELNSLATRGVMERCRHTLVPNEATRQVTVQGGDPALGTSVFSNAQALLWLEQNGSRIRYDQFMKWKEVSRTLAHAAGQFTLDLTGAWSKPPDPAATPKPVPTSDSGPQGGPEPEVLTEPMDLGEEERQAGASGRKEEEVSPSSSAGAVETAPPPPKRICTETLPGVPTSVLDMAKQACVVIQENGSPKPDYWQAMERVAAAEGGEEWLSRWNQYLQTRRALRKPPPLADFQAMAPPPFIRPEDRAPPAQQPPRSRPTPVPGWEIEPTFEDIPPGDESFHFVFDKDTTRVRKNIEKRCKEIPQDHRDIRESITRWLNRARTLLDHRKVIQKVNQYIEEAIPLTQERPRGSLQRSRSVTKQKGKKATTTRGSQSTRRREQSKSPAPTSKPPPRPPTLGSYLAPGSGLTVGPTVLVRPSSDSTGRSDGGPGYNTRSSSKASSGGERGRPRQSTLAEAVAPCYQPAPSTSTGATAALVPVPAPGQRRNVLEEPPIFDRVVSGNAAGFRFGTMDVRLQNTPARVSQVDSKGFPVDLPLATPPVRVPDQAVEQDVSQLVLDPTDAARGSTPVSNDSVWEPGKKTPPHWFDNRKHPPHTIAGSQPLSGEVTTTSPTARPTPVVQSPRQVNTQFSLNVPVVSSRVTPSRVSPDLGGRSLGSDADRERSRWQAPPPHYQYASLKSAVWEGEIPAGAHMMVTFRDRQGEVHTFYGDTLIPMQAKLAGVTPNPLERIGPLSPSGGRFVTEETRTEPSPEGSRELPSLQTSRNDQGGPESSPLAPTPGEESAAMETDSQKCESAPVDLRVPSRDVGDPGSETQDAQSHSAKPNPEAMEEEESDVSDGASQSSQDTVIHQLGSVEISDTSVKDSQRTSPDLVQQLEQNRPDLAAFTAALGLSGGADRSQSAQMGGRELPAPLSISVAPAEQTSSKTLTETPPGVGTMVLLVPATTAGPVYSPNPAETMVLPSGNQVAGSDFASSHFSTAEVFGPSLENDLSTIESGDEIIRSLLSPRYSEPSPPPESVDSGSSRGVSASPEKESADPSDTEDADL